MSFDLNIDEGEILVKLAREAIMVYLSARKKIESSNDPRFRASCGVFVTLKRIEGSRHSLRGCIGHPYPVKPLEEAIIDSAINSATRDPRFKPASLAEMDSIIIEVSVLTPPEPIVAKTPDEIIQQVVIGRDGLIIGKGLNRGLLLPQVPVDWNWDAEEFLTHCCMKAGIPPDSWLTPDVEISTFTAIIFAEEKPNGLVTRVTLS